MLFYKLQKNALQTIQKYNLSLVESGMGSQFTYTKITDKVMRLLEFVLHQKQKVLMENVKGIL